MHHYDYCVDFFFSSASQRHATGQTKQMKKSNTGEISDIVNIPMQQEQRI